MYDRREDEADETEEEFSSVPVFYSFPPVCMSFSVPMSGFFF